MKFLTRKKGDLSIGWWYLYSDLIDLILELNPTRRERNASEKEIISTLIVTGEHLEFSLLFLQQDAKLHIKQYKYIGLVDGKIIEHRAIRDDLTFMMQLGLVGSPLHSTNHYSYNVFIYSIWYNLKLYILRGKVT